MYLVVVYLFVGARCRETAVLRPAWPGPPPLILWRILRCITELRRPFIAFPSRPLLCMQAKSWKWRAKPEDKEGNKRVVTRTIKLCSLFHEQGVSIWMRSLDTVLHELTNLGQLAPLILHVHVWRHSTVQFVTSLLLFTWNTLYASGSFLRSSPRVGLKLMNQSLKRRGRSS